MTVEVLVEIKSKNICNTFTYKYLPEQKEDIKVGKRVLIPFGRQEIEGYILKISDFKEDEKNLKYIIKIIDENPVLNQELIELGKYISSSTLCSLISAYDCILPSALKAKKKINIKEKMEKYIKLNVSYDEAKKIAKNNLQNEIVEMFKDKEVIFKKTLKEISESALKTLIKNNVLFEFEKEVYRYNKNIEKQENNIKLTEEQNTAYEKIIKEINLNRTFLIHGVTGSGKTEVYIKVIESVINNNKEAIMLVPEISLTPQFIDKFISRFGENVAILHSGLSNGEKYDEWRKIEKKEVQIVIGTRSAIFAPFDNLGVIIIDEEHSDTYKQDNVPRYNAKDIASFRAKYHNIPLILGSATPDLIDLAKAKKNIYTLIEMPNRVGTAVLPDCYIVDMAEEMKKRNTIISSVLHEKILDRLSKNEQIILLLNRRGHSTFINCSQCGYIFKCKHCDISMIYHKTSNMLRCHYCGYSLFKPDACPNCNEDNLTYLGLGTQKLEEELRKMYSEANIIRMDADTTTKKGSLEKIITDFQNEKYNILLGTQMISKGLNFPKVTLVGIINADATLNIPDYKSNQRTFELLYQTSGRAGRNDLKGEVIIQTFNPDNYTLNCVMKNDFNSFYNYEMDIRRKLKYPPYYYLCVLKIASKSYEEASKESIKVVKYLNSNLSDDTKILGPSTASVFKFNNIYRFQVIIKYRKDDKLYKTLADLQNIFNNNTKVNLEIDMSPSKI